MTNLLRIGWSYARLPVGVVTVGVPENPYFTATDERGRYSIPNVPAGNYKLKAWHERLPSQVREITVPETGEVRADFTLGITNLPKY